MKLSPRARRVIPLTALLALSIVLLLIVGLRLVRATLEMRNLRQVRAGEAVGVRPWMTVPYIAHTYGVPEEELFAALNLPDTHRNRRAPLQALAARHDRDLAADIATLNATVDARRGPVSPRPPPARPRPPTPPPRSAP